MFLILLKYIPSQQKSRDINILFMKYILQHIQNKIFFRKRRNKIIFNYC